MPEDHAKPLVADGPENLPKLVRFLAQEGSRQGRICYG